MIEKENAAYLPRDSGRQIFDNASPASHCRWIISGGKCFVVNNYNSKTKSYNPLRLLRLAGGGGGRRRRGGGPERDDGAE